MLLIFFTGKRKAENFAEEHRDILYPIQEIKPRVQMPPDLVGKAQVSFFLISRNLHVFS